MAYPLKRAWFARIAVGMAALAFPLLAVGSAQAAIAGANPESTSNRPDLVSATALNSTTVLYCFDKQLNNVAMNGPSFLLGGYRSTRVVPAFSALLEQTVDTTGKCVRATFGPPGPAIGDIGQYTVALVLTGSNVQTTAAVTNPISDSTALTVPASLLPTHNGTTGFTTSLDLTGVIPDPTTNSLTYVEDQAISTALVPVPGNFYFTRPGGTTLCTGLAAPAPVVSGNQVTVFFGPVATCPVSDAVRAGQLVGALPAGAAADPVAAGGSPSPPANVIVPNTNGVTSNPDLTGVKLESNLQAMDFTFDKQVSVVVPTGFNAILSNGTVVPSVTASVIASTATSTTLRVTFDTAVDPLANYAEFVVGGSVNMGAVKEVSPPLLPNQPDAGPAGGNAGAFARGFTTAPDAFGALISASTGVVTIALDQRAFVTVPAGISLVDGTGNITFSAPAGSVTTPAQAAGPETITVQFSPGQVATAKNLALAAFAALGTNALGNPPVQANEPQIMSAPSTASILHRAKLEKPMSKKQVRAIRARVRAEERALLAKLHHRSHHR
jgi:hypothetical protein